MKKKQATESVYLADHEEQTAIFVKETRVLATMAELYKEEHGFYPYRPSQSEYGELGRMEQKSADSFWTHNVVCSIVKRGQQADALADLWFRLYADTHH